MCSSEHLPVALHVRSMRNAPLARASFRSTVRRPAAAPVSAALCAQAASPAKTVRRIATAEALSSVPGTRCAGAWGRRVMIAAVTASARTVWHASIQNRRCPVRAVRCRIWARRVHTCVVPTRACDATPTRLTPAWRSVCRVHRARAPWTARRTWSATPALECASRFHRWGAAVRVPVRAARSASLIQRARGHAWRRERMVPRASRSTSARAFTASLGRYSMRAQIHRCVSEHGARGLRSRPNRLRGPHSSSIAPSREPRLTVFGEIDVDPSIRP